MPVLKHISPVAVPVLPKAVPLNTVPSAKIKMAGVVWERDINYKGFAKKVIPFVNEQIKFFTLLICLNDDLGGLIGFVGLWKN
jgi:hypothetical protein